MAHYVITQAKPAKLHVNNIKNYTGLVYYLDILVDCNVEDSKTTVYTHYRFFLELWIYIDRVHLLVRPYSLWTDPRHRSDHRDNLHRAESYSNLPCRLHTELQ